MQSHEEDLYQQCKVANTTSTTGTSSGYQLLSSKGLSNVGEARFSLKKLSLLCRDRYPGDTENRARKNSSSHKDVSMRH